MDDDRILALITFVIPSDDQRRSLDARREAIVEVEAKSFRIDLSRARWSRSVHSRPADENRVEVAFIDNVIAVRDSEDPAGPTLIFTAAEWDAFLGGAKDGEFDL